MELSNTLNKNIKHTMGEAMKRSQKMDFARLITEFLDGHKDALLAESFDATNDIAEITALQATAVEAEDEQLDAKAIAKQKTAAANAAINACYTKASSALDSIIGAFGKENEYVQELRKLRKR